MSDIYFANDTPDELISYLMKKSGEWMNAYITNNYIEKIRRSWESYHGVYYANGHKILYGGEQGELVNIAINHYRSIAVNMLTMITANRPAFQARSTNTDSKSEIQTNLANGLLEYYTREKRLEVFLKRAAEYAIVLGSGYVKLDWNSTSGKIYDYIEPEPVFNQDSNAWEIQKDPTTGEPQKAYPVYEGDIEICNLSPLDVVYDSTKETFEDNTWVVLRTFKNKYDLAAKYPEYADKIKELRTKSSGNSIYVTLYPFDQTMDVPVYEFYHKQTEALPNGRYALFLSEDIVLMDTNMPYRELPIYRITGGDFLGTAYGYTIMFDLLPIQNAVNSLYSTIMTNQNAFGVQNILNPRGNDVRVNQVEGGLNFVEYNPLPNCRSGGAPEPLNLTQTPPEIFNFLKMLEQAMEAVSSINSVARGNPEASLKSGTALALVQSQALQSMSGLQQSYIRLIEDVGTGIINILKDFAMAPRVAAIVGLNQRVRMQEFTGEDLSSINRVLVDASNPLSQTVAGRVQMAEQMLQMKLIDTPEKYIEVMNTGKLTSLTENQMNELTTIRAENEELLSGKTPVLAIVSDRHSIHLREHRTVLADPKIRISNPELIKRVSDHIQEHIDLLKNTDPNLLAIFGEQALSSPGGTPNAPAQQQNVPQQGMDGMAPTSLPSAAGVGSGMNEPTMPGQSPKAKLPKMPSAPQPGAPNA